MKINNNTKPTIKHENQTKTKLSPQGPQWSRHSVARVWRRGDRPPHSIVCVSGKYRETRNSCLLLVENRMGVAT
jgi:hypothetical protein